jgi:hypothetical protein
VWERSGKQESRHPGGLHKKLEWKLFHRGDARAQAGLVTGSGVLMDHTLFDGLVDHGDGAAEGLFGLLGVARLDGLAQLPQRRTKTRGVGPVGGRACLGLARALQCRKMICHGALNPRSLRKFSDVWPKSLFYLELEGLVK